MREIECSRNIHPGGLLKEEIEYRKLSKRALCKKMDVPYKLFMDILNERKALTEEIAVKLEEELDIPASLYMSIQVSYDVRAEREKKEAEKCIFAKN